MVGCASSSWASPTLPPPLFTSEAVVFSFLSAACKPSRSSKRLQSFLKGKINRPVYRLCYITSLLCVITVLSPQFSIMAIFAEGQSQECVSPRLLRFPCSQCVSAQPRRCLSEGCWLSKSCQIISHPVQVTEILKFKFSLKRALKNIGLTRKSLGKVGCLALSKGLGSVSLR